MGLLFFAPFLNRPSKVPLFLHDLDCFDQRKTRVKEKKNPFLSCSLRSTHFRTGGVVTSQKNDFTRSALHTFRSSASVRNIFHEFVRGRVNTTSKPNFSLPLQTSAELNAVKQPLHGFKPNNCSVFGFICKSFISSMMPNMPSFLIRANLERCFSFDLYIVIQLCFFRGSSNGTHDVLTL